MALLMAPVRIGEFTNARWKTGEQVPKVRDNRTSPGVVPTRSQHQRQHQVRPGPGPDPARSRTLGNYFGEEYTKGNFDGNWNPARPRK